MNFSVERKKRDVKRKTEGKRRRKIAQTLRTLGGYLTFLRTILITQTFWKLVGLKWLDPFPQFYLAHCHHPRTTTEHHRLKNYFKPSIPPSKCCHQFPTNRQCYHLRKETTPQQTFTETKKTPQSNSTTPHKHTESENITIESHRMT